MDSSHPHSDMNKFRLDRELTREVIINIAPMYVELLRELQSNGRSVKLPDKLERVFRNLQNLDQYVMVFDDERRIHTALLLFLFGQDGLKEYAADLKAMTTEQQTAQAEEFIRESLEDRDLDWAEDFFPDTPEKEAEALAKLEALNPEEKEEALKRAGWFWYFFFGWFYQYLSLMLHGQKLTTLVDLAKQGDADAFGKAVHVEPRLLYSHPYFRERHEKAREGEEEDFLKRIGYRIANPGSPGRIRYPGLYVVFAMLEVSGWLDGGFTHEELLDICDEAQLDRWQNRIEDTSFLAKRLREYRKSRKLP